MECLVTIPVHSKYGGITLRRHSVKWWKSETRKTYTKPIATVGWPIIRRKRPERVADKYVLDVSVTSLSVECDFSAG